MRKIACCLALVLTAAGVSGLLSAAAALRSSGGLTWLDAPPASVSSELRCQDGAWRRIPAGYTALAEQGLQDIWLVRDGLPANVSPLAVSFAVSQAARTWTNTVNDCELADRSSFNFRFMGSMSKIPLPDFDGIQTVVFAGGVCHDPLHVACLFPETDPATGDLVGWDIVLDPRFPWGTQQGPWLDVQAIVTHELGHVVGLDDMGRGSTGCSSDHLVLVMYACTWPGDTLKRTLALGDAFGVEVISNE